MINTLKTYLKCTNRGVGLHLYIPKDALKVTLGESEVKTNFLLQIGISIGDYRFRI